MFPISFANVSDLGGMFPIGFMFPMSLSNVSMSGQMFPICISHVSDTVECVL